MGPHLYSPVGATRMFGKVGVFFEALAVWMYAHSCQTPKPRVNRPFSISQERGEECDLLWFVKCAAGWIVGVIPLLKLWVTTRSRAISGGFGPRFEVRKWSLAQQINSVGQPLILAL